MASTLPRKADAATVIRECSAAVALAAAKAVPRRPRAIVPVRRRLAAAIASIVAGWSAVPAAAQTWLGTTAGYGTAGNWSSGAVPIAGQTATINAVGLPPILSGNFAIGILNLNATSLTINATRIYTIGGSANLAGATLLGPGTLQLGGGAVGALFSGTGSAATVIGGSGSVSRSGAGTTTLTGANTYTGATTVSGGALNIRSNTALGTTAGGVSVASGAALELQGGITVGNEALALNGSGVATDGALRNVSGNNSWAGAVTLGSASRIHSDAGLLSLSGAIGGGFGLSVGGVGNTTFSGALGIGAGTLTKEGSGTLVLSANNSFTGGSTVSAGTLQVGAGGTTGTLGSGAVLNDAALVLNRSNALTVANAISGSGSLTKLGASTTTLTGANSFSGSTTITAGSLSIGSGGILGTLGSGDVINNATLIVNRSDAFTLANDISGSGALTKLGTGTTTLLGDNSYAGTTSVSAGILQVGNGGTAGTLGSGNVANSGSLRFNRSDDVTLANLVSGSGTLFQLGTGTLTLTATNTYTGVTTVSAGTLQVGDGGTVGRLGTGSVVNNATLAFDRSDSLSVANAISGSGAVQQIGSGTTVLTAANTYSGITTVSAGTLQVGAGGTTGTLGSGAVLNDAALVLNRSNALTVANAISGSGSLTKLGASTTTLTGANSFSGSTTITAGSLSIGSGGILGTLGSGDVINNATLIVNRSDAFTLANDISGSGALTKLGTGTTTLLGDNSYAGTTSVSAGILQVGNGGTAGTLGSGNVANSGSLRFNRSDDVTLANLVSGGGTLFQLGTGTLTLTATNTYTGVTTVSAGTLQVGDGGTVGRLGTGSVVNNATLAFDRSDSLSVANAISGSGAVQQIGSGTTVLTAANTYSGITTVSAGTLQVGAGGTTGTLGSGAVLNDAALVLNRSNALTVANAISGSGSLTKLGASTTTLTGANSFSGSTTITAGSLSIGSGGILGTLGSGDVINNATLIVNRSDAFTLANDISGSGALTKLGTGTTTLLGDNSYAGTTSVNAGVLSVQSSNALGSPLGGTVVAAAAALQLQNDIVVAGEALTLSGSGIGGSGALRNIGGSNRWDGPLTLSAASRINADAGTLAIGGAIGGGFSLNVGGAADTTIEGVIGTGAAGLNKDGAGRLILSGANTYDGATAILAGAVNLRNASGLGSNVGATSVAAGAALQLQDNIAIVSEALALAGTGIADTGALRSLSGNNAWSGAITLLADSRITADAAMLSLDGGVAGAVALTVGGAGETRLGGTLDVASLVKDGPGTLNLRGTSTIAGPTTIAAGTLRVGDGAASGTLGIGAVVNEGTLAFDRADLLNVGNIISGSGALQQLGSGTTVLTGANRYAGTTAIVAGTLQVGDGGTSGTLGSGAVVNDGSLNVNRSDSLLLPNAVSGSGSVVQAGSGTTVLTGSNSYAGTTTIAAGTLQVGNGATSGSLGSGAVINDGTLIVNRSDTVVLPNAVSGNGALVQAGSGTTVLTGANSYSGPTTVTSGTLTPGNALALGSAAGGTAVAEGAALQLQGSIRVAAEPLALSGNGVAGGGALRSLDGDNRWGGALTLAGAGRINADAGLLTLEGHIGGDFGLTIGGAGDTLIAGPVATGSGSLTKDGSGTLTLAGINTYAGATTVVQGSLRVLGSIAGAVSAEPGTTVGGTGSVGTLLVKTGAIISPGDPASGGIPPTQALQANSPARSRSSATPGRADAARSRPSAVGDTTLGTFGVAGNFSQPGAYLVNYRAVPSGLARGRNTLEGASAPQQDADLIHARGSADLSAGTLLLRPLSTPQELAASLAASPSGQVSYLIVRAEGGRGGTEYVALSSGDARIEYPNANDVELVLGDPAPPIVTTAPPAAAVARDQALLFGAAANLARQRPRCDTAGGDVTRCGFVQGSYGLDRQPGDTGAPTIQGHEGDGLLGLGFRMQPELWLGFALGTGQGTLALNGNARATMTRESGFLWGRWWAGDTDLRAWLGGASYDMQATRGTLLAGSADARYSARQGIAAVEARLWHTLAPALRLAPLLGLQASWLRRNAYRESGGGIENFDALRQGHDSLQSLLGAEARWQTAAGAATVGVEGSLGWAYRFGNLGSTTAGTYAGDLTQTVLSRTTPSGQRNELQLGLSMLLTGNDGATLRLGYFGGFAGSTREQSMQARFTVPW